jgi:hypothetical protein
MNNSNIVVLSDYSSNNNLGLIPVTINTHINPSKFSVGNLIIKETYKTDEVTFSYTKETMIIIRINVNDSLSIDVQPVVRIDVNKGLAYVTDYDETLHYINERWYNNYNLDSERSCENVILVGIDEVMKKTQISKSIIFEEDGKNVNPIEVKAEDYKPVWCHL